MTCSKHRSFYNSNCARFSLHWPAAMTPGADVSRRSSKSVQFQCYRAGDSSRPPDYGLMLQDCPQLRYQLQARAFCTSDQLATDWGSHDPFFGLVNLLERLKRLGERHLLLYCKITFKDTNKQPDEEARDKSQEASWAQDVILELGWAAVSSPKCIFFHLPGSLSVFSWWEVPPVLSFGVL